MKNHLPKIAILVLLSGAFAPDNFARPFALARADAASALIPTLAKQDGPPLRDGDAALFRFRAPKDTEKVFLAGSFNAWGNNEGGKISDSRFALTPAGDGLYFARVPVDAKIQSYKYVVLDKKGDFNWTPDPQVKATDDQGNTVLDFSQIRTTAQASSLAKTEEQPGLPLRDGDRVLFRFRAPDGSKKVYLAGSFNNFADNNGTVSDDKFAMTAAGDNCWFKWVLLDPKIEAYKFVAIGADGQTQWIADPQVKTTDANGNGVVNFAAIESIETPKTAPNR